MNELKPQGSSGRTADRHHESKDLNVRAVALFGLGLAVVLVAVHVGMGTLFGVLRREGERQDVQPSPMAEPRAMPPGPGLEVFPRRDLETVRKAEKLSLGSYGWIDRSKGVVRIPIDRALELIAEQGLPMRKSPERGAEDH